MSPADLEPLALIAAEVAAEWGVELGPPFALSRYSYVAPAGDGRRPEGDAAGGRRVGRGGRRARAMGRRRRRAPAAPRPGPAGAADRARPPGDDISGLPEDEATAIAVAVGQRLWRPAAEPFRWIGDHVPRWLDQAERSDQEGRDLIPFARELYASLAVGRETLVHGDFHHHNILRAGDRYLAIDAKAMLGEPEFDVASFLWNPLGSTMRLDVTERRLAAFAAAGLDQERMRAWAVIRGAYLGSDENEERVLRSLVR